MKQLAILVSSIALNACAASQTAGHTPAAPAAGQSQGGAGGGKGMMGPGMMSGGKGMMGPGMGKDCPLGVEGTTVRAEEVAGGAAMVFTTTGDVSELRRRVTAMAEVHNKPGGQACPMMAMHQSSSAPTSPPATPADPDHAAHHPKTDAKSRTAP